MKKSASKARVGLLIFLGVITLTVGTFFVGEKSQLFSTVFYVRVNFKSAEGVKPGGNVLLSGYTIGTVWQLDLSPTGDSVRLTLRLEDRIRPILKTGAKAFIAQEGLVGNKFIRLDLGQGEGIPVEEYGFIRGIEPFGLSEILNTTQELVDTAKFITGRLKDVMVGINSGQGTLGRLLVDESIYDNVLKVTSSADSGLALASAQLVGISTLLSRLTLAVNRVVDHADSTVLNAMIITGELATFTRNVNEGKGTLGAFMKDRALYDSLTTLMGLLQNVSIDASNAADQMAKGIYAMRTHWLLGRIFGGDEIDKERSPESSYERKLRDLNRRERELSDREKLLPGSGNRRDSLDGSRR